MAENGMVGWYLKMDHTVEWSGSLPNSNEVLKTAMFMVHDLNVFQIVFNHKQV
jgi:hypothetical protein